MIIIFHLTKKKIVEEYVKIKQERRNIILEKEKNNQNKKTAKKEDKKETKKEKEVKKNDKKDDLSNGFDIIDECEVNTIKNNESQDEDLENNDKKDIDYAKNLDGPLSKSDANCQRTKINLWEVIVISNTIKKNTKNDLMKSIVSKIVYNSITFKDKLSDSTSKKSIIIYDKLEENYSPKLLKKIQESFIYMSYRTGLVNTKFLPRQ